MQAHRRRYLFLFFVSLSLHVLIYLLIYALPKEEASVKEKQTLQIALRKIDKNKQIEIKEVPKQVLAEEAKDKKPNEESKPEDKVKEPEAEEQAPIPIDNADEVSSNNQNKDVKGRLVGGGQLGKTQDSEIKNQMISELNKDQPAKLKEKVDVSKLKIPELPTPALENVLKENTEVITTLNRQEVSKLPEFMPSYLAPLVNDIKPVQKLGEIKPNNLEMISGVKEEVGESNKEMILENIKDLGMPGNILMLADAQLSEVTVPQPFSNKKSAELKLVNEYLKRMNKQVMANWVNPYQGSQVLLGIIKIELNIQGYLVSAYVYRESGDKILDISVLDAIRAVNRFQVPNDHVITERYYQNLKFHYSSIKQEVELMPFETKSSIKQEN